MKTAIIYYTFGGFTKKEAERLAAEQQATLFRVTEAHNRSFLGAFIPGGFYAMKRKKVAITPASIDVKAFDRIIIGCPVWAGFPAPAFNAIVDMLPGGKEVELFLCSGGGETPKSAEGTRAMIEAKGCKVAAYRDVKTSTPPGKLKE